MLVVEESKEVEAGEGVFFVCVLGENTGAQSSRTCVLDTGHEDGMQVCSRLVLLACFACSNVNAVA